MTKKTVVIGILGTKLDRQIDKRTQDRWKAWRPSVSICQQEDIIIDRFHLLSGDDDQSLRDGVAADIQSISPETEVVLHDLTVANPWDFEEVFAALFDWSRSLKLDLENEDYLVHITTGTHVQQICLFLLTESRHFPGRLLQSSPSRSRNQSGGKFNIIDLDLSRYDALATRFAEQHSESLNFLKSGIPTRNQQFNQLIEEVERVTLASTSPILLYGPTGAGKSQLARRIYELKQHRKLVTGPLVEVNCATLRGDQAMPTLFGHTKGAFTGAAAARMGLLRKANHGVLFLDEIGELGLDEQAMLLRAVEDKTFQPVGSDEMVGSNFQLIAGTHRDLAVDVQTGRFREDLLARINLWDFRLPGLSQRREDIEPNLNYELNRFANLAGQTVSMNREAREQFLRFALSPAATWNANFRDLNAAVTRMGTLSRSGRIGVKAVQAEIERLKLQWRVASQAPKNSTRGTSTIAIPEEIDLFDEVQLRHVVDVCQHSKSLSDAGRKLFAVSRVSKKRVNDADRLRKYLAKFALTWEQIHEAHQEDTR